MDFEIFLYSVLAIYSFFINSLSLNQILFVNFALRIPIQIGPSYVLFSRFITLNNTARSLGNCGTLLFFLQNHERGAQAIGGTLCW